jgi:hypothetical protein
MPNEVRLHPVPVAKRYENCASLPDGWTSARTPFGSTLIAFSMWVRAFLWLGLAVFMAFVAPEWGVLIFVSTVVWNLALLQYLTKELKQNPSRFYGDRNPEEPGSGSGQGGAGRPVLPAIPPTCRTGSATLDWPK